MVFCIISNGIGWFVGKKILTSCSGYNKYCVGLLLHSVVSKYFINYIKKASEWH